MTPFMHLFKRPRLIVVVLTAVILLSYALFGHIKPGGETASAQTEEYTVWYYLGRSMSIATEMMALADTEYLRSLTPEEFEAAQAKMANLRQEMEENQVRLQEARAAEMAARVDRIRSFRAAD